MAHERLPGYWTGRPSLYRPEYCKAVQEHMGKGRSLTAFAGEIKVSIDAVQDWIATHPEFSLAVKQAQTQRVNALEERLLSANNGGTAATSIFALKNACPAEWREVRYENIEHSVNLDGITDEQLAAIALGRQTPMIDVTPKKVTKR
jgi:hypothetical protein